MMPIAMPDVLDPDRPGAIRQGGEIEELPAHLVRALRDSCAYGQLLWQRMDALRSYLYQLGEGYAGRLTGAEQWEEWARAFIAVSGLLAGPRGDAGYAASEAHRIAREHGMELTVEPGTAGIHADAV